MIVDGQTGPGRPRRIKFFLEMAHQAVHEGEMVLEVVDGEIGAEQCVKTLELIRLPEDGL